MSSNQIGSTVGSVNRPNAPATRSRTLAVTSAGTFIALVAFTMPLTNLPTLARALSAGPVAQSWILASMSVGLAAVLLAAGSLGDEFGRRRIFVGGSAVLTAGSVLTAIASEPLLFIAGRIVEGLGGAALIAASLAIVSHTFTDPADRAMAAGVWGASVGAGIAAGPLITALLTDAVDWRAGYVLMIVLGIVTAVVGRSLLDESRSDSRRHVDVVGTLIFSGAMVALLTALVEIRQPGKLPISLSLFAVAALLAVAFVVVESKREQPLLEPALFRNRDFTGATVAAFATGAGVIGLMSFSCTFLINALQLSTIEAATLLFAWSATSVVASLFARRMPPRWQGSKQLAIGLAGVGVGQLMLAETSAHTAPWTLLPGLIFAGIASGILNAGLGRQAAATAPPGRTGLGSGVNNTARYLGSAIGVTVVSTIAAGHHDVTAMTSGWNHAALVTAAVSLAAAAVIALRTHTSSGRTQPVSRKRYALDRV